MVPSLLYYALYNTVIRNISILQNLVQYNYASGLLVLYCTILYLVLYYIVQCLQMPSAILKHSAHVTVNRQTYLGLKVWSKFTYNRLRFYFRGFTVQSECSSYKHVPVRLA